MVNLHKYNLYQSVKDKYLENIQIQQHKTIAIALSGGSDSVVLLDILSKLSQECNFKLIAVHVNHGISANASYWSDFCTGLVDSYSVDIQVFNHTISKIGGKSLEDLARVARYASFTKSRIPVIATAHHQDDQVETILSQILRGNHPNQCYGMNQTTKKNSYLLWRPLLDIPKVAITDYILAHNLQYITDESNSDNAYLRNMLRNNVLPVIKDFDNNVNTKILNFANQLREDYRLLERVIVNEYNKCIDYQPHLFIQFPALRLDYISNLDTNQQMKIIHYYLEQLSLPKPSNAQLSEFMHQYMSASQDKHPQYKIAESYYLTRCGNYILAYYLPTQVMTNTNQKYYHIDRVAIDNGIIAEYNHSLKLTNGKTVKEFYAMYPTPPSLRKVIPIYRLLDSNLHTIPQIAINS